MTRKQHSQTEMRALLGRAERLHQEGKIWREVASCLGIAESTLYRWRQNHERSSPRSSDYRVPELSYVQVRRLTKSFGRIAAVQQNRITTRVRILAQNCFAKSFPLRPQSSEKPLLKATKALRNCLRELDNLPEATWRFVELSQDGDWPASEQRRQLVSIVNRFTAAAITVSEYVRSSRDDQGGPLPDGRLVAFINALWVIYYEESHERPTHKTDKEGLPVSRYNQFVQEAVRLYYPQEVPWSAVKEAMRVSTLGILEPW